uniref:Integrase catalytic domain-containing protein n=1 Tax=Tanacetum cinerariifolium TaxID=118510 RepID=A0A6L2JWW1_TANCI|nr:hypothetical protein [Tanacetum cinerariifolium]
MAAQLPGLQEEVLEGIFIKGLKQELRTAVRTQQPTGLGRTMELALVIDESRSGGVVETHKDKVVGTRKLSFKRMFEAEYADKKSKGYSVIMVVVDRLSKSTHFAPLKHPYTAASVATVFLREIIRRHGVPKSIVSDRDRVFVSHFWRELFKYHRTTLKRSTAYHPQTDGQSKVVNHSLETYLRCFASFRPNEWVKWLPWAEYWYNTSYHSRIYTTPFKALYGRDPPSMLTYDHGTALTFEADRKRRDVSFGVGDKVYLKLRLYRQGSVVHRASQKLASRLYGPYKVLERVEMMAYRLKLPPASTIYPVFHVSQLKKVIGNQQVKLDLPATNATELAVEPDTVLGTRKMGEQREVLIG